MQILVTVLYVLSGVLSLSGAFVPWFRALRVDRFASRAMDAAKKLDDDVEAARRSGDAEVEQTAWQNHQRLMARPFEGSEWSLGALTRPIMFGGGTVASRAGAERRSREQGLWMIAVGVALGAVASVLSVWCLPG